jgi:hypothetical protein
MKDVLIDAKGRLLAPKLNLGSDRAEPFPSASPLLQQTYTTLGHM